jgi:C4-dicarboxylate-binding protein DctP
MKRSWSRRGFMAGATAIMAAPVIRVRAAADAPLTLRCSIETPPAHTRNGIVRDYLQGIEKAMDGRIKTQLFESGQLFPDLQVGKALLQGQIEMALPGTFALTSIVSDADFIQLPALYGRPIEAVHEVIDGKAGQLLARQIEQRIKAHVIGPWLDLGFFNWYSTAKALNGYDDLKGLKIRNNGGAGQAWRTQYMGAIPNTTPLPGVPLALSQGTFDGLITSYESIASGQFWESGVRHALEDHQFVGEYVPMVSLGFWDRLSSELQVLFTESWKSKIAAYRMDMAAAQARARYTVESHGITVVVPEANDVAARRRAMIAYQDHVAKLSNISPEMVAIVMADLAALD